MSRDESHIRVGAYVVDALDDEERRDFERHLAGCSSCRHEVRGLTETTALLGAVVAQQPPESLREQVMRRVAVTRQLPPQLPATNVRRLRVPPRFTAVAAAACLIVAIVLGVLNVQAHQRIGQLESRGQRIESVLGAPDAKITSAPRTRYGTGTLAVSKSRGQIVFTLEHARRLADNRAYQLWYVDDKKTMRSAGLMPRSTDRATLVGDALRGASTIGLTVEPRGGSAQPTTDPVMQINVA